MTNTPQDAGWIATRLHRLTGLNQTQIDALSLTLDPLQVDQINDADLASLVNGTLPGLPVNPAGGLPLGLPGATSGARFVGGTVSGPPSTGIFQARDYVLDGAGVFWICTVGGSPGTWVDAAQADALAAIPTPTAVKTGNYTATANQLIPVDTTSGNVTVTLPTAPADKTRVLVKHVVQGGSNTVTVARGGSSDVFNKAGGSTSLTLTYLNQAVTVQYKASGGIWYVVADDLPVSAVQALGTGTFVAYAPAPTGVAATDTAALTALANAAVTAGGGEVLLRAGTYKLNAGLPIVSGLSYRGVEPGVVAIDDTSLPDGPPNFTSGTVLQGDGTFTCFSANTATLGALPLHLDATWIRNFNVLGVGFDNFVSAFDVGGVNNLGLMYSRIDRVFIKNCSSWAARFTNFMHCKFGYVWSWLSGHGQYYGNIGAGTSTLICGNSSFESLYNVQNTGAADPRLCRGIVFESAGNNSVFNLLQAGRIQNNAYNRAQLSVTATFTNTSTSVAVPDGTKFAPHMPVIFTATGAGFAVSQVYVVQSVTGNNIVLGDSFTGTAKAATATTTLTLQTYGMPNIEFSSLNSNGGGVGASQFNNVDAEGTSTVGVYIENAGGTIFNLTGGAGSSTVTAHVVARKVAYSTVSSNGVTNTDFDSTSASTFYYGAKGVERQRSTKGMWVESAGTTKLCMTADFRGDLQSRANNMIYPTGSGIGEKVVYKNTAESLVFNDTIGVHVFAGSSPVTHTLPTVTDDATPASSNVGCWFEFVNQGSATLTIATDGAQVVNLIAGRFTITIAPGSAVRVTAVKNTSGTLYWLARAVTLVT